MEKFRDHEKEYKSKRPTKAAMLMDTEIKGKFNYGSGSDFDGEYGEDGDDLDDDDDDDINEDSDTQDIVIDKQWLASFVTDTLRSIMTKSTLKAPTIPRHGALTHKLYCVHTGGTDRALDKAQHGPAPPGRCP